MKIKHFHGYGTINASKISKTTKNGHTKLVIKLSGNHECGLIRNDKYDVANWLVKRFDKSFQDYRQITGLDINSGYENGIETAIYTIEYDNED